LKRLALIAIVFASACNNAVPAKNPGKSAGSPCQVSTECAVDLRCSLGMCIVAACSSTNDCKRNPAGACGPWSCVSGLCEQVCPIDAGPRPDANELQPDAITADDAQTEDAIMLPDAIDFDATGDAGIADAQDLDASVMDGTPMDAQIADAGTCSPNARAPRMGDLLINEILADPPPGAAGDANGDGTRSAVQDEFIEIGNVSTSRLDLSGVVVSDSVMVRHTFATGTAVDCGKVIVVFGGGDPRTDTNWKPNWVPSTTGDLSLNNNGDTVNVGSNTAQPSDITSYTYGVEGGMGQSIVRTVELTATPFILHSTHPMAGGRLFSPGTRVDGTPF
jgi:hypothetical protein